MKPQPASTAVTGQASDRPELSDEQVDRILSTQIPGGSAARDWFLPHEAPKGLANVRDVVRRMVATAVRVASPIHLQGEASLSPTEERKQ